jgi:hypothetical protein
MLFDAIAAKQMATAALLIALTAPQDSSVSSFFNEYDRSPEARPAWDMLVLGIEIGLTWANANMQPSRNAGPLYCQPNTIVMTVPQLIDILRHASRDDAVIARAPLGAGILRSLQKAFPCAAP